MEIVILMLWHRQRRVLNLIALLNSKTIHFRFIQRVKVTGELLLLRAEFVYYVKDEVGF